MNTQRTSSGQKLNAKAQHKPQQMGKGLTHRAGERGADRLRRVWVWVWVWRRLGIAWRRRRRP